MPFAARICCACAIHRPTAPPHALDARALHRRARARTARQVQLLADVDVIRIRHLRIGRLERARSETPSRSDTAHRVAAPDRVAAARGRRDREAVRAARDVERLARVDRVRVAPPAGSPLRAPRVELPRSARLNSVALRWTPARARLRWSLRRARARALGKAWRLGGSWLLKASRLPSCPPSRLPAASSGHEPQPVAPEVARRVGARGVGVRDRARMPASSPRPTHSRARVICRQLPTRTKAPTRTAARSTSRVSPAATRSSPPPT